MAKNSVSSDASLYLKIGSILQKPHRPEQQAAIQKILDSDLPMAQKLERIEAIDRSEPPVLKSASRDRRTFLSQEMPRKNALLIKKQLQKAPLLKYLFSEYRRISAFGQSAHLFSGKWFRFKSKLPPAFWPGIQKDAGILKEFLDKALESGWAFLDKFEYNGLVQLRRLCEAILRCGLPSSDSAREALEQIREVELPFLICHYETAYPEMLGGALQECMRSLQEDESRINSASLLLRKLLKPRWDGPCLYHYLLGLNMRASRTYLEMKDLIAEHPEGVIPRSGFDCSEGVREKIRSYLSDKEHQLAELVKFRKEVQKSANFLGAFVRKSEGAASAVYDYAPVVVFYESGIGSGKYRFERDCDNFSLLVSNLAKRFSGEFAHFLCGKVKTEPFGAIPLFTADFFHNDFSRLEGLVQRIGKLNFAIPGFSLDRFNEIKSDPEHSYPTREEREFIRHVDEWGALMMELGQKAGHLSIAGKVSENPEEALKPLDPSLLISNGFTSRLWGVKLIEPICFENKPFPQALREFATLTLLTALFLGEERAAHLREREMKLQDDIQKVRTVLERVADSADFQRLKTEYSI